MHCLMVVLACPRKMLLTTSCYFVADDAFTPCFVCNLNTPVITNGRISKGFQLLKAFL